MLDLLYITGLLAACFIIGFVVTRSIDLTGRHYAAPLLGFGTLATMVTLLYRYGFSVTACFWVSIAVALTCLISTFKDIRKLFDRKNTTPILLVMAVILLGIAPKWVGGPQFYSLQVNPWDQMNYLKMSTTYSLFTYDQIKHPVGEWLSQGNMNGFTSYALDMRPGVNIVHASSYWPLFDTANEAYYPYMAFLQLLMACSVAFLILQLAPKRGIFAFILGAIFSLGPLYQHPLDLNAWSQMAGMPLAYMTFALGCACVSRRNFSGSLLIAFGMSLSGLFYIYPEIVSIVAVAGIVATLAHFAWQRDILPAIWALGPAILATGVAALYYDATLSFLFSQGKFAQQPLLEWAVYHDAQLLGRDVDYYAPMVMKTPFSFYQYMSLPIDLFMGAAGMSYLLPWKGLDESTLFLWKGAAALYILCLLSCAFLAAAKNRTKLPIILGLLACFAIPSYVFFNGYFWSAGKALGMASPALFVLMTLPVIFKVAAKFRLTAMLLLAIHLGFAIARPIEAANPDGVLYPAPYSHHLPKPTRNWDIFAYGSALTECRGVHLNLKDPHLDTFVQVALTGKKIGWRSLQPIRPFYEETTDLRQQPGTADCLVTDLDGPAGYKTTIDLRRSN
ncbi:hypothetical protein ACRQ1B_23525 [Rhizobium panacihumi]|uniref:hypothetical protein n=1 Tax=Rhizobium panacihumi TaxID=2008450 RepID=UPI003D796295